jgi:hypothetical protein
MRILADHIEAPTRPTVEEWKGPSDPLVTEDYDWTADSDSAGSILYSSQSWSRIRINLTIKHNPYVLGAVLAHELAHHYLYTKELRLPTTEENEQFTDLATVYLGLGKLTLNGYEPIRWTVQRKGRQVQYSYKVGYLSAHEMAIIMNHICSFRSINIADVRANLSDVAYTHLTSTHRKARKDRQTARKHKKPQSRLDARMVNKYQLWRQRIAREKKEKQLQVLARTVASMQASYAHVAQVIERSPSSSGKKPISRAIGLRLVEIADALSVGDINHRLNELVRQLDHLFNAVEIDANVLTRATTQTNELSKIIAEWEKLVDNYLN